MSSPSIRSVIALALLVTSAMAVWQLSASVGRFAAAQTAMVERELIVEGMHCASCPVTVRLAAERIKGVKKARVSMKQARAWVTFDPAITTATAIAAAITKAGYPARPAEKNPQPSRGKP